MIEIFRQMLIQAAAAAILGGLGLQLVRDGPLHEIVRLAAGLLMTLALLLPLARLPALQNPIAGAFEEVRSAAALASSENQRVAASSVGNAIAVYIEDRAKEMGVQCTAAVHMEGDENGRLSMGGVTLWMPGADPEARSAVCEMVVQECGVPIYLVEVREP